MAPAGDYVVRVSTLTDGATTLLLLDELLVRAEPKMCDASQKVSDAPISFTSPPLPLCPLNIKVKEIQPSAGRRRELV